MALQLIEQHREGAEVCHGDELGQEKDRQMLKELEVPSGLLPLKNILEVGVNRKTNFVWVTQKQTTIHRFRKAKKTVSFGPVITAIMSMHRATKVTGVKVKEFKIWVTVGDIYLSDDLTKITMVNPMTGFKRTLPASYFEADADKDVEEEEEEEEEEKEDKEIAKE